MTRRSTKARRIRRPWTALTAVGAVAHHGFELGNGLGLVLQPELGLPGASALWGTQLPLWFGLAATGNDRWNKVLAVGSGAALGGALIHFTMWPCRRNRLGLPVLIEAEGLSKGRLPAYNAILYAWMAVATMSLLREIPAGDRRWALLGIVAMPALRKSARHHFEWMEEQATANPTWWNRGLVRPADYLDGREAA